MRNWRALSVNGRFGASIFIVLMVLGFAPDILSDPDTDARLRWNLLVGVLFIIVVVVSVFAGVVLLFFPSLESDAWWVRWADRAAPLLGLMAGVLLTSTVAAYLSGQRIDALIAAKETELAGPEPRSIIYSEGIPDGGRVIVRSPGVNPEKLPAHVKSKLTPERLKTCKQYDDRHWMCGFD